MSNSSTVNQTSSKIDTSIAPLVTETSLEQRYREFTNLRHEIEQLKHDLRTKHQELADLKQCFPERTKIRSQVNRQARKLNNLKLSLPNFLIIGTQKGGTTWLHENLKQHPEIFLPSGKKELEFFSYYDKKIADYGLADYLKHFNQFEDLISLDKPKAIGEATPSYFWSIDPDRQWSNPTNEHFNHQIPQSVYNILGKKVKLILCLRNPVHRAISAYFHHIKRDRIDYKTQSILDVGHLHGIIDMGFYAQHLNAWLAKFDLSNFKVLIYEKDIKHNKQKTIEDICQFLKVDYQLFPTTTNLNKYHNKGLKYRLNEEGAFLIFPDRDETKLVVTPEEITKLKQIYVEDSHALQSMLKLDLSELWQLA